MKLGKSKTDKRHALFSDLTSAHLENEYFPLASPVRRLVNVRGRYYRALDFRFDLRNSNNCVQWSRLLGFESLNPIE